MPLALIMLCALPLLLQAGATLFDEFYFHHRRGLSRWEAYGHPLDTLTVVAALSLPVFAAPAAGALGVYVALSAFSCFFVTKDEFVHRTACPAGEQWLHAVLFVLHPMVFFGAGLLWWAGAAHALLAGQLVVTALFGIYQFTYWRHRGEARLSQ